MHERDAERPDVTRVSPELALVDPELARRLRLRLPRRLPPRRPPVPVLRLAASAEGAADPGARRTATESPSLAEQRTP
jgi:hypothetical protein